MLQQSLFGSEQELNPQRYYQGGSPASLTALQESVRVLVMSMIYGESSQELFATLTRDGLWQKMSQGYCQVKLDGTMDEYLGTWPKWGIVSDGVAIRPHGLEPYINESEFSLLPTPTASEWKGRGPNSKQQGLTNIVGCTGATLNPEFVELIMGFPPKWTELNV